jgi:hypothetical protein
MSEKDAIERLRDMGFTGDFQAVEGGLKVLQTGEVVPPEEAHIRHIHRFEGASDISDEAIVYGIEAGKGRRGVLVDAYGPYASPELAAIIDRMPVERSIPKPGDRPPKPY